MLPLLKEEANLTLTQNGAVTNISTLYNCLDLFFLAGASRNCNTQTIRDAVVRAYAEDHELAARIIFFARDVRGGLGERRFFRTAIRALSKLDSEAVCRLAPLFAEYGRFDDLCALLDTPCEKAAAEVISAQLAGDKQSMAEGGSVSLLAKWLPSANASSNVTRQQGRHIAKLLGMTEKEYRITLSSLRKYADVLENRLRVKDYSFDYEKQPSNALFKYRSAFFRNDSDRFSNYLAEVNSGSKRMHTGTLYPYEIVRRCMIGCIGKDEEFSLNTTWEQLPAYGENSERAIAVVDGSGSMTWSPYGNVRPIDVALSLGLYFAEHNSGAFAGHFITFSEHPRLVEIKGSTITEKVMYCASYNECANTNLEATFELILNTALKNRLKQSDLPEKLYIISDMEFDCCVNRGNDRTLFRAMEARFREHGYKLPEVVFWNVNSLTSNCPVTVNDTGCALVSGFTPALFDIVAGGQLDPTDIMLRAVMKERYDPVAAACA